MARHRRVARAWAVAALALVLTGCGMTEYRGPHAAIDGSLWRLVSSAEDGLRIAVTSSLTTDADAFFAGLPAVRWNGTAADIPNLDHPVAVVYDDRPTSGGAAFSVFVSSGQRPDGPTDRGTPYDGPDSVFTCWSLEVRFGEYAVESSDDTFYADGPTDCPDDLIAAMPGETAFAEPLVFTG